MVSIDGVGGLARSGLVFDYAGTGFVRNCVVSALACPGVVRNAVSNEAWWSRSGSITPKGAVVVQAKGSWRRATRASRRDAARPARETVDLLNAIRTL